MSNEMKDWLWDTFSEVVLNAEVIDKVIQIIPYDNFYAIVHGIKDGYHVKYNVWYDYDDGYWNYERNEE